MACANLMIPVSEASPTVFLFSRGRDCSAAIKAL